MALETADVVELLDALRRIGAETEAVEVKSGRGGFPRSVRESVVAFANGDGGTVVVGVDEAAGFSVVPIPDISGYGDQFAQMVRDDVTPALDTTIDLVAIENSVVLVAQISPARLDQKPAYVTSQGVTKGAYIRVGDGDRRMTEGEIALTYSARSQPM